MRFELVVDDTRYQIDLRDPRDISTRLEFDLPEHRGAQPNAFGIDRANARPFRAGDWVGDTREGGSANCFVVTTCPHGNGTHTECVGHIVDERVGVADILEDTLLPAWVTTVAVEPLAGSDDYYEAPHDAEDEVISRAELESALEPMPDFVRALVIRTTPNPPEKRHARFSGHNPPYLSNDAMKLIRQRNIKHLLVDLPSVDREEDRGALTNHRIFWDVAPGATDFENVPSPRTITEMIYVEDTVDDGLWALTIQIPDFVLDAAPSRVRLFPMLAVES
jgi:kynurenine formamidase